MRSAKALLFLAILPLLAVIGHDLYRFYLNPHGQFLLSATGFLWTKYAPGSYDWAREQLGPESWAKIGPLLTMKAAYAAAIFAAGFYIFIVALFFLGKLVGLFHFGKKHDDLSSILSHAKKEDFHYKKR